MIHELLHDLLMEQNKVNGEWKDDIDPRVDELKANEGRRVCPVCQTTMKRVRRNNSSYIRAGQLSFAPLFHRSSSSKYALIDLHDR